MSDYIDGFLVNSIETSDVAVGGEQRHRHEDIQETVSRSEQEDIPGLLAFKFKRDTILELAVEPYSYLARYH